MSTIPLDARTVLAHLNELGYRNITPEQLKEFLKDLRKLIKYEERIGALQINKTQQKADHFDYLHKTPTASSRAKTFIEISLSKKKQGENLVETEEDPKTKNERPRTTSRPLIERNSRISSAPVPGNAKKSSTDGAVVPAEKKIKDKDIPVARKSDKTKENQKKRIDTASSNVERPESRMWIRPRSATPSRLTTRTTDPVMLYHYYQKQWQRFKKNLPGENDHADLRWQIRHKLLGAD